MGGETTGMRGGMEGAGAGSGMEDPGETHATKERGAGLHQSHIPRLTRLTPLHPSVQCQNRDLGLDCLTPDWILQDADVPVPRNIADERPPRSRGESILLSVSRVSEGVKPQRSRGENILLGVSPVSERVRPQRSQGVRIRLSEKV